MFLLPDGKVAFPSKRVHALKTDNLGRILRNKARWVCRVDLQVWEGDYDETFTPVVRWKISRLYLALTVLMCLIPLQQDVDLAYLYADLADEIYVNLPSGDDTSAGYVSSDRIKSLYGLKQAGRSCNR